MSPEAADHRNAPLAELIESVKARKELCESADVYGWVADRFVAEIERLRERLSAIATMEDEADEWDAVSKFTACRLLAREVLA